MKKGQPINIRMVHNGYIVEPDVAQHMCVDDAKILVFNDFKKMTNWMNSHFVEDKIPERDLKSYPTPGPLSGK